MIYKCFWCSKLAWQGEAGLGAARHGMAGRGWARQAWRGQSGHGKARFGLAGLAFGVQSH
jgi:hypothetical protein